MSIRPTPTNGPSSGAVHWEYQLPAPMSVVPIVAGGRVYVGDTEGHAPAMHTLDARTGALLWRYPSHSGSRGFVTSLVADEARKLVYVGADSGLLALEAATGRLRWQYPTGPGAVTAPRLDWDTLYLTADGVYALAAADGTLRWHDALGASPAT